MYKHLLIATDGSEWASKALTQGLGLAKSLDAKATVVMATAPWNDVVSGEVAIALPMWRACAGSVLFAACVALTGVLPGAAERYHSTALAFGMQWRPAMPAMAYWSGRAYGCSSGKRMSHTHGSVDTVDVPQG